MLFTVLGPVGVHVGGRRISLAHGHERTALAVILAADGDVVSADQLIDALWGARPPASARKSMHSHVSRLRRSLGTWRAGGADRVLSVPGGYRIDADIDARQFLTLAARP
ncbi:MAG TPA: winged helix-turn-helix domain-containing protein, partial [Actinomycetaceae bacterium]|nr:winged helix-turn-helix domain-containing protein [Actinomycetaceae bacterium]